MDPNSPDIGKPRLTACGKALALVKQGIIHLLIHDNVFQLIFPQICKSPQAKAFAIR